MSAARVLIADERAEMRSWLRIALRPLGVSMRVAHSGKRALQILSLDGPFDLVVADAGMRGPTGLKLVELAQHTGGVATPFILITDAGDDALHRTVSEMGDAVVLDKPFDEGHLQALASRVIAEGAFPGEALERAGA